MPLVYMSDEEYKEFIQASTWMIQEFDFDPTAYRELDNLINRCLIMYGRMEDV